MELLADSALKHCRSRPSRVGEKVRAVDESMVANFSQYGLSSKYLGVIAADFCLSPWRNCQMFQCIITDPPYGIREATEKIGMLLVFGVSFLVP